MRGGFARAAATWVAIVPLAAGCVAGPPATSPSAGTSNIEPQARRPDKDVIQHVLESSVQVVLERNGDRFRTGSGVVIVATPDGTGSECLVLSSGHTFAGVKAGDENETYVLLDRHQGIATKVRAHLVARKESAQVDLALLRVRAPRCLPAAQPRRPKRSRARPSFQSSRSPPPSVRSPPWCTPPGC